MPAALTLATREVTVKPSEVPSWVLSNSIGEYLAVSLATFLVYDSGA